MSDVLTIDVDASKTLAAFDRLIAAGDEAVLDRHVKNASGVTSGRIAQEGRARVARRTGQTASNIVVEEEAGRTAFNVRVKPIERAENLPIWLEFGTIKMTARPFLFASARLEEGPHERRIAEAVQDAIDEVGLGD